MESVIMIDLGSGYSGPRPKQISMGSVHILQCIGIGPAVGLSVGQC